MRTRTVVSAWSAAAALTVVVGWVGWGFSGLAVTLVAIGSSATGMLIALWRSSVAREANRSRALQALAEMTEEADQTRRDIIRLVERVRATEKTLRRTANYTEALLNRIRQLEQISRRTTSDIPALLERVRELESRAQKSDEQVKALADVQRAHAVEVRSSFESMSRVSAVTVDPTRIARASHSEIEGPLLSIAIPSYNRPDKLAECLTSIETEIERHDSHRVEVAITDDQSTIPEAVAIAVDFAERHPYAKFVQNQENIGLERNLIQACVSCTGTYLLILGNDDALLPGMLDVVVPDFEDGTAGVYLYEKRRVSWSGDPASAVPGSTPVSLAANKTQVFASPVAAASATGLLSTFGFVSQVVMERSLFMGIDANPFFGLNMYPQVGVLLTALRDHPVQYRNTELSLQRSPTQAQKLAESFGRREEVFMAGGREKLALHFGTAYAAWLQRLVDRQALTYEQIVGLPERLYTPMSLTDWLASNATLGAELGIEFGNDVLEDAQRLFDGVGLDPAKKPSAV